MRRLFPKEPRHKAVQRGRAQITAYNLIIINDKRRAYIRIFRIIYDRVNPLFAGFSRIGNKVQSLIFLDFVIAVVYFIKGLRNYYIL